MEEESQAIEPGQDAQRQECKTKIREWILLGYSVREINNMAEEMCPWSTRKTIRKWQQEVRNALSLSEGSARKNVNVNRGVMRQRLEYLFHLCLVPGGGRKQDAKTALECLKQLMVIDGLSKPTTIDKRRLTQINVSGDAKMNSLPTAELKRIAEGGNPDVMSLKEVQEVYDVETIEVQ